MHFVYILYSEKYDKYYIGQTKDLEIRLLFHNELSEKSFTSKYRPWKVIWSITLENGSQATIVEKYIKGRKSRSFNEALISDDKRVKSMLLKLEIIAG